MEPNVEFTRGHHKYLFSAKLIQLTPLIPSLKIRFYIILPYLLSSLFPSGFPTKFFTALFYT
jgi:hypothetical protein